MLMQRIERQTRILTETRQASDRARRRPCPGDFEERFIAIGRQACEESFRANRRQVTRWLDELGKERLIELRAAFVRDRNEDARRLKLLSEVAVILKQAIPIRDKRKVSFTVARHAAHHLRVVRNGGFVVSQAPNGDWRVGARLMSAAQMLDFAIAKGFDADLSDAGQMRLGCAK